ncbi:hypothetical protein, partial [Methanobrevibacter sp.]
MVFCQVPFEEVLKNRVAFMDNNETETVLFYETAPNVESGGLQIDKLCDQISPVTPTSLYPLEAALAHPYVGNRMRQLMDTRFHQCGDYARCLLGLDDSDDSGMTHKLYSETATTMSDALAHVNDFFCTWRPKKLTIYEAKSYIFGFNLNQAAKEKLNMMLLKIKQLKIPAQWIEHTSFPQQAGTYQLKLNTMMNLYECGQLIMTFPNSVNQLTVSRNPMLNAIKCQVDDHIIPDKMMSTYDRAHSEMTLTALGFDSLFAAPPELIKALSIPGNITNNKFRMLHEDDSNYMFVADLERSGAGIFHDGLSKTNVAINFDGTYQNGVNNPHYYEYDPAQGITTNSNAYQLRKFSPHIYAVSDAYWAFGPNGGEFIKDAATIAIINEIEAKKEAPVAEALQAAEGGN